MAAVVSPLVLDRSSADGAWDRGVDLVLPVWEGLENTEPELRLGDREAGLLLRLREGASGAWRMWGSSEAMRLRLFDVPSIIALRLVGSRLGEEIDIASVVAVVDQTTVFLPDGAVEEVTLHVDAQGVHQAGGAAPK